MKNILTFIALFLSLSLSAQFAGKLTRLSSPTPSTGTYAVQGVFASDEGFSINTIDGSGDYYYLDNDGNEYQIVAISNVSAPIITFEFDTLVGQSPIPSAASEGLIATKNVTTNQYYIASNLSKGYTTKVLRVNTLIEIGGGPGSVDESLVRSIVSDSLALDRSYPQNRPYKKDPLSTFMKINSNGIPVIVEHEDIVSQGVVAVGRRDKNDFSVYTRSGNKLDLGISARDTFSKEIFLDKLYREYEFVEDFDLKQAMIVRTTEESQFGNSAGILIRPLTQNKLYVANAEYYGSRTTLLHSDSVYHIVFTYDGDRAFYDIIPHTVEDIIDQRFSFASSANTQIVNPDAVVTFDINNKLTVTSTGTVSASRANRIELGGIYHCATIEFPLTKVSGTGSAGVVFWEESTDSFFGWVTRTGTTSLGGRYFSSEGEFDGNESAYVGGLFRISFDGKYATMQRQNLDGITWTTVVENQEMTGFSNGFKIIVYANNGPIVIETDEIEVYDYSLISDDLSSNSLYINYDFSGTTLSDDFVLLNPQPTVVSLVQDDSLTITSSVGTVTNVRDNRIETVNEYSSFDLDVKLDVNTTGTAARGLVAMNASGDVFGFVTTPNSIGARAFSSGGEFDTQNGGYIGNTFHIVYQNGIATLQRTNNDGLGRTDYVSNVAITAQGPWKIVAYGGSGTGDFIVDDLFITNAN